MSPEQVIDLLSTVAAFDRRTVGKADVVAWHAVLDDIRYVDAEAVVLEHFRTSREWLMPATIRAAVRALRDRRLEGMDVIQPPADLTPWGGYLGWLRATRAAVADGETPPAPAELKPRDLRAIAGVFPTADDAA